jgi:PleD family two-component response regulator
MKVVVLDESRKRRDQFAEVLQGRGHTVTACSTSSEFMEAVQDSTPDAAALDVDSWTHGMALYKYFQFTDRLESIPVIMYNAPENYGGIAGRTRNEKDSILPGVKNAEPVADALQ